MRTLSQRNSLVRECTIPWVCSNGSKENCIQTVGDLDTASATTAFYCSTLPPMGVLRWSGMLFYWKPYWMPLIQLFFFSGRKARNPTLKAKSLLAIITLCLQTGVEPEINFRVRGTFSGVRLNHLFKNTNRHTAGCWGSSERMQANYQPEEHLRPMLLRLDRYVISKASLLKNFLTFAFSIWQEKCKFPPESITVETR